MVTWWQNNGQYSGQLGHLFGFFKSNASLVNVCLFIGHQHEHGRHLGFNTMSTVFQIYKGDMS